METKYKKIACIEIYGAMSPILQLGVIANIQKLIDQTKDDNLKDRLSNLKKRWMNEEQQISNQLTVAKYRLEEKNKAELTRDGYGRDIINLVVEFKEAGASSLDHEIIADFSGKVAQNYNVLARAIQRIAVDACNKYGWVIPFTQVTLHTATAGDKL